MRNVDVIVVSYNSARFLPRLAESLKQFDRLSTVSIVDNDSSDDSVEVARMLDWGAPHFVSALGTNVGFGAAINQGAFAGNLTGTKLLVVNPDVAISRGTLEALSDDLDSIPNLAAVGAALSTAAGQPVSSGRRFPSPSLIARRTVYEIAHEGTLMAVDWVSGALMLWDRAAFTSVGGFSKSFFLYYEDVDICQTARSLGWSVMIDGRHGAVHDQGHGKPTSALLRRESRKSRRRYARKWYGFRGLLAASVADCLDAAARVHHKVRGL